MSRFKKVFEKLLHQRSLTDEQLIKRYLINGRVPWSEGYSAYRWEYLKKTLMDAKLLKLFASGAALPAGFAYRLDERAVEYAWVFSQLSKNASEILDAGSTFNFEPIIDILEQYEGRLTIMTLAPEARSYWNRGISYQYGDLRTIPFRDNWFDEIVSISTIEHIGFDNSIYWASDKMHRGNDIALAMQELIRILKPGGILLITVPFGKEQDLVINGKVFARQFDTNAIQTLLSYVPMIKTELRYFRYCEAGWQTSTVEECQGLSYFNIHETSQFASDYAAAARAVACIRIEKLK